MALQKEVVFKNGVIIKYHRINNVTLDNKNKKVKVEVSCYTDETFREKEKENFVNKNRYEEIMNIIMLENNKPQEERDTDKVIELSNEANTLVTNMREDIDLSVIKIDIDFAIDLGDVTMENLYNLIKEEAMFKDSLDI